MTTIDYRKVYWGHNFWTYATKVEGADYHVLAISTPGIRVDDVLLWETEYGYCQATVLSSKWKGDPNDMYELEVKITGRFNNEDVKLD